MLPGLLIGSMLPFLFTALTMTAVGKAAKEIVLEVRRQFKEIAGLMEGTAQPDYARAVDISTRSALREMIIPGVLAVASPLLVGFILGREALAGMLIGATAAGFLLAVMMANAGGAWDNAKKWIETGEMGGKGSPSHKAAVVGDTVGDPFKDTSGPSLNILIKLMSIVAWSLPAPSAPGCWASKQLGQPAPRSCWPAAAFDQGPGAPRAPGFCCRAAGLTCASVAHVISIVMTRNCRRIQCEDLGSAQLQNMEDTMTARPHLPCNRSSMADAALPLRPDAAALCACFRRRR